MYYERFREEEECCAIDKDLFVRKPIENEELIGHQIGHITTPNDITTLLLWENECFH